MAAKEKKKISGKKIVKLPSIKMMNAPFWSSFHARIVFSFFCLSLIPWSSFKFRAHKKMQYLISPPLHPSFLPSSYLLWDGCGVNSCKELLSADSAVSRKKERHTFWGNPLSRYTRVCAPTVSTEGRDSHLHTWLSKPSRQPVQPSSSMFQRQRNKLFPQTGGAYSEASSEILFWKLGKCPTIYKLHQEYVRLCNIITTATTTEYLVCRSRELRPRKNAEDAVGSQGNKWRGFKIGRAKERNYGKIQKTTVQIYRTRFE